MELGLSTFAELTPDPVTARALPPSERLRNAMFTQIGRERGWPPLSRADFDASTSLRGANAVGSPEEVAEKILFQHELFGHQRFLLYMSCLDHATTMRGIELCGTEVAPLVRAEVARRRARTAAA